MPRPLNQPFLVDAERDSQVKYVYQLTTQDNLGESNTRIMRLRIGPTALPTQMHQVDYWRETVTVTGPASYVGVKDRTIKLSANIPAGWYCYIGYEGIDAETELAVAVELENLLPKTFPDLQIDWTETRDSASAPLTTSHRHAVEAAGPPVGLTKVLAMVNGRIQEVVIDQGTGQPTGVGVGQIGMCMAATPWPNWHLLNGQALSRTGWPALWNYVTANALVDDANPAAFGSGDGSTTFTVPDLAGLFPKAADGDLGGTGGSASHDLTHNHGGSTGSSGSLQVGILGLLSSGAPGNHTHSIGDDLGVIDNQPPFFAINFAVYGGEPA